MIEVFPVDAILPMVIFLAVGFLISLLVGWGDMRADEQLKKESNIMTNAGKPVTDATQSQTLKAKIAKSLNKEATHETR